jgi:transcriptional regulator with XRE-family HTH domain
MDTPKETLQKIGKKLKEIRLSQNYKRQTIAIKSGVSESSLKRFESTGEISLDSLIKISTSLGITNWINSILAEEYIESLDALIKSKKVLKKRGVK